MEGTSLVFGAMTGLPPGSPLSKPVPGRARPLQRRGGQPHLPARKAAVVPDMSAEFGIRGYASGGKQAAGAESP